MSATVFQAFSASAATYGERPFLRLVSDTARRYDMDAGDLSYDAALAAVDRLCARYSELALRPGSRVAISLDNRPEMFLHWLALNALGVSVVPLNPQWRSGELEYVFGHSEVSHVICLADRLEMLREVASDLDHPVPVLEISEVEKLSPAEWQAVGDESTECALLYTSGTTGKPKGCVLSNAYFLCTGRWYRDVGGLCQIEPGKEALITPLPMYHMNAMATSTMAMLLTGGCIVPLDRFHPSVFWQSVQESKATILHYLGVMPVMLMGMDSVSEENQHRLKFGFGAGLSGELHTQFEERFGFKLIEAWAMTETGCTVAIIASEEPRNVGTACFGRPGAHIDYRLVDDAGKDVPAGQAGELLIRRSGDDPRAGFFSCYLKDPTATAEAWQDGYFHTGDLVRAGENGALHFVDRKKNVIRRSGENIAAVEVEEILLQHPAVQAVGVAAVPDAIRGDEVFACVVLDAPSGDRSAARSDLAEDIVQYCLQRLAYYKAPGYVGFLESLPLTATEKVQRAELKQVAQMLVETKQCIDVRHAKSGSAKA